MPSADPLIGYLSHYVTPQQRHYYGGILTTDLRGMPREFRHTDTIKPSPMQSLLYGETLELAVGSDAVAPALYSSLTRKPDLLLIETLGRSLFGSFLLQHTPSGLLVPLKSRDLALGMYLAPEGHLVTAQDFDLKGSTSERIYAYLLDNPPDFDGEEILRQAQSRFNLMNPFERVRKTLEEIAQASEKRGNA